MVKYSSFLLIASLWFSTVLYIGAQTVTSQSSTPEASNAKGNEFLKTFFNYFKDVSTSSNAFVTFIRDGYKKSMERLEEEKNEIKDIEGEAKEMEKKIQKILKTLQESTTPIKKDLQSELKEIGNAASTELKKMTTLDLYNNFETVKSKFTTSYNELKGEIEAISTMVLAEIQKTTSDFSVAHNKVSELIKKALQNLLTIISDEKGIHDKFSKAQEAHSTIRNGLIKAEQIEFYALQSHKDHANPKAEPKNEPKIDPKKGPNAEPTKDPTQKADSSIRTSLTKCVFAIILGMLF